ncbi:MAG: lipopolysaccharide biosynthesis protein [Bacteroidota bacterium]
MRDTLESTSPNSSVEDILWSWVRRAWSRRWLLIGVSMGAAIASILVSLLLLPVWFKSTSHVMIPESGGGGTLTAMLGDLGPAAAALVGGSGGDYIRYLAILNSRTMMERTVEEFDLEAIYETRDEENPDDPANQAMSQAEAIKALRGNTEFGIDRETEWLAVHVWDQDPNRAADMANFLVATLNEMNARLQTESATNYRAFMEDRYAEAESALDSARARMQRFQEQNGVVQLETQAEAFLTAMADYKALTLQGEIEYDALRRDYGEDNALVQAARNRVTAARAQERRLRAGNDPMLPISMEALPAKAREYTELMQELLIQQRIIEFSRPLLEQAIFDEQREAPAVQVLDPAVPAPRKDKPKRAFIVIGATLSAFLLTLIYVLVGGWLEDNQGYLAERMQGNGA